MRGTNLTLPSISLCMIVRNEGKSLRQCLNSVAELLKELVIVDTGSTDNTRIIAKEFGAKVFDFEWNDDFAAARNYGLDNATGKWILVLDADEVLTVEDESFIRNLNEDDKEGYFLKIINLFQGQQNIEKSEDHVVRLFRNRPQYRFSGVIHEQVKFSIIEHAGAGVLGAAPWKIIHPGYLPEYLVDRGKIARNIAIIEKHLTDETVNPFLLYSLGCEHFVKEAFEQALQAFQAALPLIPENEGYLPDAIMKAALCMNALGEMEQMRSFLAEYEKRLPDAAEILYLSGMIHLIHREAREAETLFKRCLENGHQSSESVQAYQVYQALGEAALLQARLYDAAAYFFKSFQVNPGYLYPLKKIIEMYRNFRSLPELEALLAPLPAAIYLNLLQNLDWEQEPDLTLLLLYVLVKKEPAKEEFHCSMILRIEEISVRKAWPELMEPVMTLLRALAILGESSRPGIQDCYYINWQILMSLLDIFVLL